MPNPSIAIGQTGQLVFVAYQAGIDAALIASVSWQPQGSQQHVRFTPPDRITGLGAGRGQYKVTVSFTTPGEKVTYAFAVDCADPAQESGVMPPITIAIPPAEPAPGA